MTSATINAVRRSKRRRPNPLRADPTRTAALRRKFGKDLSQRFARIRRAVVELLSGEDALGVGELPGLSAFNQESRREKLDWLEAYLREQQGAVEQAFCPTGEGGGIDPSCPSTGGKGGGGGEIRLTRDGTVEGLRKELPPDQTTGRLGTKDIGPVTVRAYRIGAAEDKHGRGIYMAGDREGAEQYAALHPGYEVKQYEVRLERPLLAGHQNDVTQLLFGKPYSEVYGGGVEKGRKADVRIAKELKKRGYDGLILLKPAPPAKSEVVVFKKSLSGNTSYLTLNQRWRFLSTPEKVRAFQIWLKKLLASELQGRTEEELWKRYVEEGLKKGAGRAFDDVARAEGRGGERLSRPDFYQGSRDDFLRSSFRQPVAVEKVKLLAGRVFTELEGVTEQMGKAMTRTLTDGLVQGKSPREIARDIVVPVDSYKNRALVIARTETIRAHAEGQLMALEELGVEEVGVMVEWLVTHDDRLCPKCADMGGKTFSISEAHGLIPAHPQCRCAFAPANVGEEK